MTETLQEKKVEIFSLEKLQASQLPELQGLKEKQLQIVKENPFVTITDNKTFEEAKKSRTTLVSARTEIQNQDKAIASKIKKFREMVAGASEDLIAITKPHEDKQQEEVRRWEAVKETERLEKQRIEDERISKIKTEIEKIFDAENSKIQKLTFETIETLKVDFEQNLPKINATDFQEFELDFCEKVQQLHNNLQIRITSLTEKEAQRVEAEKLKAEREKLDADRKELEEKQAAENARIAKEKADSEAKLAADKKAIEDQQKAVQNKLDADRKALEAEKSAIEKAESDKKAKELADALVIEKAENDRIAAEKSKEEAKAKAKKQQALKPEKEKAIDFLNCLVFKNELPEIKDKDLLNDVENFVKKIDQQRNDLIEFIQNL